MRIESTCVNLLPNYSAHIIIHRRSCLHGAEALCAVGWRFGSANTCWGCMHMVSFCIFSWTSVRKLYERLTFHTHTHTLSHSLSLSPPSSIVCSGMDEVDICLVRTALHSSAQLIYIFEQMTVGIVELTGVGGSVLGQCITLLV